MVRGRTALLRGAPRVKLFLSISAKTLPLQIHPFFSAFLSSSSSTFPLLSLPPIFSLLAAPPSLAETRVDRWTPMRMGSRCQLGTGVEAPVREGDRPQRLLSYATGRPLATARGRASGCGVARWGASREERGQAAAGGGGMSQAPSGASQLCSDELLGRTSARAHYPRPGTRPCPVHGQVCTCSHLTSRPPQSWLASSPPSAAVLSSGLPSSEPPVPPWAGCPGGGSADRTGAGGGVGLDSRAGCSPRFHQPPPASLPRDPGMLLFFLSLRTRSAAGRATWVRVGCKADLRVSRKVAPQC
ncbi:hypothetical protein Cadr_000031287 [Camelus dromedarius]|uniref:Uncharacterized protein n=1 Tax=Camelus dromedarius TaxID=9838 RepID=A0A5N4BXB0_CAMDR|nr:hypothetical protein Cadr_000031287 [Camelus dromedarius]